MATKRTSIFPPIPWLKILAWLFGLGAAVVIAVASAGLIVFSLVYDNLPEIGALTEYRPKIPLRVYSADGLLIGEFGEEKRDFLHLSEMPAFVREAVLAAEDSRFYEHSGVEVTSFVRAAIANFTSGRRGQGGSTITMQVARNFFLSSERTYTRKLYEVAMAFKIEQNLSKDEILEVYLNQIYLGQRAYGFSSAAQTYYGKKVDELTIGEAATIAGLPVAPSAYNPIVNPKRAEVRRNYVLGRMKALGYISDETYEREKAQPIVTRAQDPAASVQNSSAAPTVHAEYAAEMARLLMYGIFREETYTAGLNVYTTIRAKDQRAAWRSLREHLLAFDRKYGYRGPAGKVDISDESTRAETIKKALAQASASPNLLPAVVTEYSAKAIKAAISPEMIVDIDSDGVTFASRYTKKAKDNRIAVGSIVHVSHTAKGTWTLAQIPEVQSGFVSMDFQTGAVLALVGGFDFYLNMYNHVTQALRQPGSTFKPFIYSAALDKGFTPTTVVNDAPIIIDPRLTGGQLWEPRNYDGKYEGPMTLATALKKSKNLVSVRVMQTIGAGYAQEYATKFGFPAERIPAQLTTALGAGSVTPWEMVSAYSVFANGGYLVRPYLIEKVTDPDGKVLMQARNPPAGDESIRAIDERNAFVMVSLLSGVTRGGTGAKAYQALKRDDMGGKTGTSNNANDAWFAGFAGGTCAVGWMGYDQMRMLGRRETGGSLVLPMWIDYMKAVIKDVPAYQRKQPKDVTALNGTFYYSDNVDKAAGRLEEESSGGQKGKTPTKKKKRDLLREQVF